MTTASRPSQRFADWPIMALFSQEAHDRQMDARFAKTSWNPFLGAVFGALMMICLPAGSLWLLPGELELRHLKRHGVEARAEVVAHTIGDASRTRSGREVCAITVTYEFQAGNGRGVRGTSTAKKQDCWSVGPSVPILYDPSDPERNAWRTALEVGAQEFRGFLWTALVGTPLMGLGLLRYIRWRRRPAPSAA
jgi:hypothetical protein